MRSSTRAAARASATELLAAIRARTKLPVKYVINTHMHPDHVFGNVAFEGEKPMFVGHAKLPRALAARAERYLARNKELLGEAFEGTRIIPPTELVKDRLELDLGDRKLLIEAHATAHTDNDVTVLDEKTGTMFLGDLLFAKHVPALDGSIRGWLALIGKLNARKDVQLAVPGHGPASMPWPSALAAEQRYLSKVADDVRGMIKQGKTLAEAARDGRPVRKRCVAAVQGLSCAQRFGRVRRIGVGIAADSAALAEEARNARRH